MPWAQEHRGIKLDREVVDGVGPTARRLAPSLKADKSFAGLRLEPPSDVFGTSRGLEGLAVKSGQPRGAEVRAGDGQIDGPKDLDGLRLSPRTRR